MIGALLLTAAAPANADAPARRPDAAQLASAIDRFTHKSVSAADVRTIACEGLFSIAPWPASYACKWQQRVDSGWRSYSSYFDFRANRWTMTAAPDTDAPAPRSVEERTFRKWLIPHLRAEATGRDSANPAHKFAIRYGYALVDLNDDHRSEAIVWWSSDANCGTGGCGLEVEVQRNGHWRVLSYVVRTRPPIRVLSSKHYGWHDIGVFDAGGGLERAIESPIRFTGREYDGSPTDEPVPKTVAPRTVLTRKMVKRPLF